MKNFYKLADVRMLYHFKKLKMLTTVLFAGFTIIVISLSSIILSMKHPGQSEWSLAITTLIFALVGLGISVTTLVLSFKQQEVSCKNLCGCLQADELDNNSGSSTEPSVTEKAQTPIEYTPPARSTTVTTTCCGCCYYLCCFTLSVLLIAMTSIIINVEVDAGHKSSSVLIYSCIMLSLSVIALCFCIGMLGSWCVRKYNA